MASITLFSAVFGLFLVYDKNESVFVRALIRQNFSPIAELSSEKAFHGYTLYPVTTKISKELIKQKEEPDLDSSGIILVDMQGTIVNRWRAYSERAELLPNCNLLLLFGMKSGFNTALFPKIKRKDQRRVLLELDWKGNVVKEISFNKKIHHAFDRLPNGNTLVLTAERLPTQQRQKIDDPSLRRNYFQTDGIQEVDPGGKVIWEWNAYDHLDLNDCGEKGCRSRRLLGSHDDWLHLNSLTRLGENRWYNQGDQRFHPDNLLVMARNWWKAFIIDKRSGEMVWEYHGDYKGGLSGGHEAIMIAEGLPGAGNILIFDNGSDAGHPGESYVLEVDPSTKKVEWVIDFGSDIYSKSRGRAQRLPNGNTLISIDEIARVIEVTADKEIVWDFQGKWKGYNSGTRAYRYASDSLKNCPLS